MSTGAWWIDPLHSTLLLWNECGEDPMIFCYRISCGAFVLAYRRAANSARLPARTPRTKSDCSISSASFFTASTTLRE